MEKVKVNRNYQVKIPISVREKIGIKVGSVLLADVQGDRIMFEKRSGDITKLEFRLGRKFDWRDVERAVNEAGDE